MDWIQDWRLAEQIKSAVDSVRALELGEYEIYFFFWWRKQKANYPIPYQIDHFFEDGPVTTVTTDHYYYYCWPPTGAFKDKVIVSDCVTFEALCSTTIALEP